MDTVTKANRDIKSLQPIAQKACELFLSVCKERNIPIFVTEYHRSQARQDWLYEQGRTREGNIVTWTRTSNHTAGYAWDIAVSPPHALYDDNIINKAGQVAKELGIEWGGMWKTQDKPHFQVDRTWTEPKEKYIVIKTKIELNGTLKEVDAIQVDGINYVKLRDIADSRIAVDYDNTKKVPTVKVK